MKRTPGFWLGSAAVGIVTAAIAAGLFVIGGPGEARLEKLDGERLDDLRRIRGAVERAGRIPDAMDSLVAAGHLSRDDLIDPATGARYGYRVLTDSTYELCATFAVSSADLGDRAIDRSTVGSYEAGRHCFTVQPDRE
jgi:hypothetical protein